MQHKIYTDQQLIDLQKPLEEGICDFEVIQAKEKISKAGNSMIELLLKVTDIRKKQDTLKDWLLDSPKMAFKLKHFWQSVNNSDIYNKGEIYEIEYLNKKGKCTIKWEESKDPNYPSKMRIMDYISIDPANKSLIKDDDLPF